MIELELLDLVDENGVPTGEVKERELVHRDGDRHRTSHVWLFRRWNGQWQVLLQKRSVQKDSHPGRFDWKGSFYGKPFRDRQVSRVYYGIWEGEPRDLRLQDSEVSEVVWMEFAACRQAVAANAIPHCIFLEELDLLAQALPLPEESNKDCCKK